MNNKFTLELMKDRYGDAVTPEEINSCMLYNVYSYNIKSVVLSVQKDIDKENNKCIFRAVFKWASAPDWYRPKEHIAPLTDEIEKTAFPATWNGFVEACKWLDGQRMAYAYSLLGEELSTKFAEIYCLKKFVER